MPLQIKSAMNRGRMRAMLVTTCFLLAMPVLVLGITAASAATPAARAATPAPGAATSAPSEGLGAAQTSRLAGIAPADAYFGRLNMSPLSIRTMIGFLGRQYHQRTISDHDLLRKALWTEDALRKWRAQYPADPWLAPTFFHLEQLYQAVQTNEARKHATAILKDTIRYYPNTKQGHLSRARLAAGFPPLVPETPLVASPQASPPASSSPSDGTPAPPSPPASAAPSPAANVVVPSRRPAPAA